MPFFFFDFENDEPVPADAEGLELASVEAACAEAFKTVAEILRDLRRTPDARHLVCSIKDGNRTELFRVELNISCSPAL